MDWDLKVPLWDLAELDRVADLNHGSMLSGPGGGFSQRCAADGMDCSVDLKLGGLGDSGNSFKWKDQPNASTATEPSSRRSKRQRGPGSAALVASCSVDGCSADLSKCRDYHRRHKVCEDHSKAPVVVVGGQEQRFCQQCSRFHSIEEFDQAKRSCRKRLDCHNRRRRKTHPNSVNSGTKLSAYSQLFPTAMTDPNCAGIIIPDNNARHTHGHGRVTDFVEPRNCPFLFNSCSSCNKEQRRFPFLQESESSLCSIATIGSLVGQAHATTSTPFEVMSSSSNKIFSNGLTQVFHSDCALSLLSSSDQASSFGPSRAVQSTDRIRGVHPLVSSMQSDITQFSHSAAEAVFVSNIANGAVAHSHSIYPTGDRISRAFSR